MEVKVERALMLLNFGLEKTSKNTVSNNNNNKDNWIIKQINPENDQAQITLLWTHYMKTQLFGECSKFGKAGRKEKRITSSGGLNYTNNDHWKTGRDRLGTDHHMESPMGN